MLLKYGRKLAGIIINKINICKESPTLRAAEHDKSFTRDRKLTAKHVVAMILEPAKQSLQTRLCEFGVKFMDGVFATKQAFSKQRQFVNPEYVREFYDETAEDMLINGECKTFKGMHLIGVDGTRLACENTPELIEKFGCSGSKNDACTALASTAYDLFERVSYDCQIDNYLVSEHSLLDKHLYWLKRFGPEYFMIVADRGYPSYDLLTTLIDMKYNFLLRLNDSWSKFISQMTDTNDKHFEYKYKGIVYNFRVLKIELEDKTEYLITNLNSDILSLEEAKYIYSLRWNIETFFGFLKTELEIENFSGKTVNSVLQEFYATMTLANVCQCFINDANREIAAKDENSNNLYEHQANRRQCVGRIVPVFLECIFTDSISERERLWKQVEQFCARFSEPIRPGRNPQRKIPRKRKFYPNARKPSLS